MSKYLLNKNSIGKCANIMFYDNFGGFAEIKDVTNTTITVQWIAISHCHNDTFPKEIYTEENCYSLDELEKYKNECNLSIEVIKNKRNSSIKYDYLSFEKYNKKMEDMKEAEIDNWYEFYTTFNDNNWSHADSAFVSNGLVNADINELFEANYSWFCEIIEHGFTPDEICNIMPNAKIYKQKYEMECNV